MTPFLLFFFLLVVPAIPGTASEEAEWQTKVPKFPPFTLKAIKSAFPADLRYQEEMTPEILKLLDQKFFYLFEGSQCYAFYSQDQKLILKLFKQGKFYKKSSPCKQNLKKKLRTFKSYQIAAELLKQETGLIYLQLSPKDFFSKKITLIDKDNNEHTVDLKDLEFAVQSYAHLVVSSLQKCIKEQDEEVARKIIDEVFVFFKQRIEKGISDRDPNILTNLSFREGKVIQIDIGDFSWIRKRTPAVKKIRKKNERAFYVWLGENSPSLQAYYSKKLEEFEAYFLNLFQ